MNHREGHVTSLLGLNVHLKRVKWFQNAKLN